MWHVSFLNLRPQKHCTIPLSILTKLLPQVSKSGSASWRRRPSEGPSRCPSWGHSIPACSQPTSKHPREMMILRAAHLTSEASLKTHERRAQVRPEQLRWLRSCKNSEGLLAQPLSVRVVCYWEVADIKGAYGMEEEQKDKCSTVLIMFHVLKKDRPGTSLMVQWWRIHLAMQRMLVPFLIKELRSHLPQDN